MDILEAIKKNLVLRTEYGAGPEFAGGLFNARKFQRQRYKLDGTREEDVVYERVWKLGPARVTHRSRNAGLFDEGDYRLALTLFGLITVSNEKDFLVLLKTGGKLKVLKHLLGMTPAGAASVVADLGLASRAGARLNVTRLLRDLKQGGEGADNENDAQLDEFEPEVDLD